jgi:ferredoxin/flavodoxin---NADP+ reductase
MNRLRTQAYNATVSRREDLGTNLMRVWISPDSGEFPPFKPGQFVSIGRLVDKEPEQELVKRSYSIGSSALERSSVQLFVVHVDDGEFTSWFFAQREGARLWLSPRASGGFTLDGFVPGKDLVLVSTGTAIAPFVSMIRTFRDAPPWRRVVVINAVRRASDLGFREELELDASRDSRLIYVPMVTREPPDSPWTGLRGRVTEAMEPRRYESLVGAPLDPDECHVFLCGNPAMIEDLEGLLAARGFRKHTRHHAGNLHLEKYWTE